MQKDLIDRRKLNFTFLFLPRTTTKKQNREKMPVLVAFVFFASCGLWIGMLVAKLSARCGVVRRRAASSGWNAARNFSAEKESGGGAEVAEVTAGGFVTQFARPQTSAESKAKKWTKTVTPWHARPDLVPAEQNAVTSSDAVGVVGQLAGIPAALLKRKVRIYRRTRQSTTSSSDKTKAWKIEFNHQHRWNNHLMGWQSNGDAAAQLYTLYFESPEQAARYCKKHGFEYTIDEPELPRDFHGKKSYSHNFLSEAVENKIKVSKPDEIASKHFKWKRPRHTMWVNQHRQPYGGEAHNPEGNKDQGKQTVPQGGASTSYGARGKW